MFAPQKQQPNVIGSMTGSMEELYNAVDEAVKKSEVIPGNYKYTVATSYGNVGQIHEDSSKYIDITCNRFKVISLDNSYITIEQDVQINVPDQTNVTYSKYYIRYKYAPDVIGQYRIYSNADLVQTQNHARYEWFMMYNSVSDEANAKFVELYNKNLTQCSLGFRNINQTALNAIKVADAAFSGVTAAQTFKCNGDGCFIL